MRTREGSRPPARGLGCGAGLGLAGRGDTIWGKRSRNPFQCWGRMSGREADWERRGFSWKPWGIRVTSISLPVDPGGYISISLVPSEYWVEE